MTTARCVASVLRCLGPSTTSREIHTSQCRAKLQSRPTISTGRRIRSYNTSHRLLQNGRRPPTETRSQNATQSSLSPQTQLNSSASYRDVNSFLQQVSDTTNKLPRLPSSNSTPSKYGYGKSGDSLSQLRLTMEGFNVPAMKARLSGKEIDTGPAPMRLGPTLGRTVFTNRATGRDVGRAFRDLEYLVAKNGVKRDFHMQRFHERPGLKRKRLQSSRWRRRFKTGFQNVLARVKEMRKMGW